MSDIVKSNDTKAVKELDTALAIIEQADAIMKNETEILRSSPTLGSINEGQILNSMFIRTIGIPTASGIVVGGVFALLGFEMASFVPIIVGSTTALTGSFIPNHILAKIVTPKKYKKYENQLELNKMLRDIANEEYDAKEQKVLTSTQKALKTANKILKEQGKEIIYSRGEGFIIKSDEPVVSSKWDTLRLQAIRQKGIETASGMKLKELIA